MMFDSDRKTILLTILVVALVLFTPAIAKLVINDRTYSSEDTYYNLRLVQQFGKNTEARKDILQDREYDFNLFHYIFFK